AVAADGAPASAADLVVSADRGRVGALEQLAPGVFRTSFRAPEVAGGTAKGRVAALHDTGPAGGASIGLRAGAPAQVRLRSSAAAIAGAGEVVLRAEVADAQGNAVPEQPVVYSTDYGDLEAAGRSARLRIPAEHAGRRRARVVARAGPAEGAAEVELRAG